MEEIFTWQEFKSWDNVLRTLMKYSKNVRLLLLPGENDCTGISKNYYNCLNFKNHFSIIYVSFIITVHFKKIFSSLLSLNSWKYYKFFHIFATWTDSFYSILSTFRYSSLDNLEMHNRKEKISIETRIQICFWHRNEIPKNDVPL